MRSEKEIEKLRKDWDVAKAELEAAQLEAAAAKEEWQAKQNERVQKEREARTKVDYARAMQQDALGQMAAIQKEKREVEIKLAELLSSAWRWRRPGCLAEGPGKRLLFDSRAGRLDGGRRS